jgi:hypothetical protein
MAESENHQAPLTVTNLPAALEAAERWREVVRAANASRALEAIGMRESDVEADRTALASCCLFDIEPLGRASAEWLVGLRSRPDGVRVEMVHVPTGEANRFASGIGGLVPALLCLGPRPRTRDQWAALLEPVTAHRPALEALQGAVDTPMDLAAWSTWLEGALGGADSEAPIRAEDALRSLDVELDLAAFLNLQGRLLDFEEVPTKDCEVGAWSGVARMLYCAGQPDDEPELLARWRAAALLGAVSDDAGWAATVRGHLDTGLSTSAFGVRASVAASVLQEGAAVADEATPVLDAWRATLEEGAKYLGLAHLHATVELKRLGRNADAWAAGRSGWSFLRARGGVPTELRRGVVALARECSVDRETLARVEAFSRE